MENKKKIKIEKKTLETIKKISKKSFPKEACALLIGNKEENLVKIKKVIKAENILHNSKLFKIDSRFLIEKVEEIEEGNKELLGFSHSHPHLSAYVSKQDKKFMKPWPNKIWLIAGINEERTITEIKAYGWSSEPVELELIY